MCKLWIQFSSLQSPTISLFLSLDMLMPIDVHNWINEFEFNGQRRNEHGKVNSTAAEREKVPENISFVGFVAVQRHIPHDILEETTKIHWHFAFRTTNYLWLYLSFRPVQTHRWTMECIPFTLCLLRVALVKFANVWNVYSSEQIHLTGHHRTIAK